MTARQSSPAVNDPLGMVRSHRLYHDGTPGHYVVETATDRVISGPWLRYADAEQRCGRGQHNEEIVAPAVRA